MKENDDAMTNSILMLPLSDLILTPKGKIISRYRNYKYRYKRYKILIFFVSL